LLKILLRSFILGGFLIAINLFTSNSVDQRKTTGSKAMFVVKSSDPQHYVLNEDDRIYIITKMSNKRFSSYSLNLVNPQTKRSFILIPETSESTFIHQLEIERPRQHTLYKEIKTNVDYITASNRIEMFEWTKNKYLTIKDNREGNYFINLLYQENTFSSSYLLHYLLFLLIVLLGIDLGIHYRILKI
jgi:hypothetical protein